jgi:DNA-binding NarL/FixJ family response regulator
MTIRVLLVDDQPLVRAGLRLATANAEDLEIVGEAGTGEEAVMMTERTSPDVVVMDIRMPVMDGIEATRRIRAAGRARVIILTTFDEDENVYAALRAGASAFLLKDMVLDDILNAVRVVAAGDSLLAPGVTRRLIDEFTSRVPDRPRHRELERVTDREREVLTLIGQGLSNGEIAERLFISVATTKSHVARLLAKLDARDRVHLVITAYEAGLV